MALWLFTMHSLSRDTRFKFWGMWYVVFYNKILHFTLLFKHLDACYVVQCGVIQRMLIWWREQANEQHLHLCRFISEKFQNHLSLSIRGYNRTWPNRYILTDGQLFYVIFKHLAHGKNFLKISSITYFNVLSYPKYSWLLCIAEWAIAYNASCWLLRQKDFVLRWCIKFDAKYHCIGWNIKNVSTSTVSSSSCAYNFTLIFSQDIFEDIYLWFRDS